jgi:DNA gyrase/topoisomerase IV subunit B
MGKLYDDKSIESLSPLEFTRLRPGVYCGSTEYSTQLLIEIVSNAIDEFSAGHGNIINVDYKDDGSCRVEDFAQGFPVNVLREDGETVLQASFDVLNTSGKFSDDGVYEGTALGLNGIGSKLTNFLSSRLVVTTYRDGKTERVAFKDGVFFKRDVGKQGDAHTGTIVDWTPDPRFFNHPQIDVNRIKKLFYTLVCLCPGLTINLTHDGKDEIVYRSEHGLNDLVSDLAKDNEIIDNRLNINFAEGKNKLDFVLTYTSNYSLNLISYVNTGETDSGPHITQVKSTITREFNKFFKEKGWLKDKDPNLDGGDIQEGMLIAFNITAPGVSYDAQTKSRIVKLDMTPFTGVLSESIQTWLTYNEREIKIVFDKAMSAKKAREAAKKARDAAREIEKKKKEKVIKFDTKLADCYSKDRLNCEVYIVEGDSAGGNLKTARDNSFQAVLPIRGKVLNCQKATLAQIQKNAEIMSMIDAFGLRLDPKTMKVTYNKDELRYGKIIIMSDADVDGAHIKNLFYTFIWNFCPDLIKDGYVYAGVPPLYKITIGKEYKYLKNDEELLKFREENKGKKYIVGRMKGLGEMDVDQVEETLTDPTQRIIKKITVEDAGLASRMFEQLMGTAVLPRKQYIKAHSEEGGQYNAE